jgi:diguanylate cyclase (GGDEF)-like protein/PAS domain S-box-containing protein
VESVTSLPTSRLRRRVISAATYTAVPLAFGAILWFHAAGLVAPTPLWLVLALLIGTAPLNVAAALWLSRKPDDRIRHHLRAMSTALTTASITYSLGWGAVLIVAFAVGAAEVQRTAGATIARPHAFWGLVSIALGEVAVQLGWAPSVVSPGLSHAIAISGVGCLSIVLQVLETAATQTEQAHEEVLERGRYFEALIEHASDIIGVISIDGRIRSMSPAIATVLGYRPEEVSGRSVVELVHPDDVDALRAVVERAREGTESAPTIELRALHRDGGTRRLAATISIPHTESPEYIVNLHDITTQHALEERLRHDASHDSLTGLLNRKAFEDHYEAACSRAARQQASLGLLYIDLDGFKEINDSYGHHVGDSVLVEAGRRLADCTRREETLARLGGDEFAVLVEGVVDHRQVIALADRILESLADPLRDVVERTGLGASIGIAVSRDPGSLEDAARAAESPTLLSEADQAMYAAKRNGRHRWELSESSQALLLG